MNRPQADIGARFHEETKIVPGRSGPGSAPLLEPVTAYTALTWFRLPAAAPAPWPALEEAIVQRRTSRSFDPGAALTPDLLGRLLAFSCGRTGSASFAGARRAAPSAGATYPVDAYVVALRVAGVPAGVHVYDVDRHALGLVRPGSFGDRLTSWTLDQPWVGRAGAVVALVGCSARIGERYAARGYRYMLFEAGHIAQNLYLLGAGYGIGVQATGGFVDAAVNRLLGLDESLEQALYLVAVGRQQGG